MTEELQSLISQLASKREEIAAIRAAIAEENKELFEEIATLEKEAAALQVQVTDGLRAGKKNEIFLGYKFGVNVPKTDSVDVLGLLALARERNELPHLIEMGVVTYGVDADQIERLPGTMKASYAEFVTKVDGTARVTLPPALKE